MKKQREIRDTDGRLVRVYPSSGIQVLGATKTFRGPFVWLEIRGDDAVESFAAHLTRRQAAAVRDKLTRWLRSR